MKIKALQDFPGSLNGYEVIFIEKGTLLDTDDATARIFVDAGFCEPVTQKPKPNVD